MADTVNLRTNELGYIKLYDICDWKKVILPSNIVVPDFNVCTNTRDTTTINTRYKPHRIVKDSHLKERGSITLLPLTLLLSEAVDL